MQLCFICKVYVSERALSERACRERAWPRSNSGRFRVPSSCTTSAPLPPHSPSRGLRHVTRGKALQNTDFLHTKH